MYLTIDVGNSNIHLGLFQKTSSSIPQLIKNFTIPVSAKNLSNFFRFLSQQKPIDGVIISDAYGKTSISNHRELQRLKNTMQRFIVFKPDIKCDLQFRYYPRKSLGTDRIADCVAAYKIYKQDCLVIDFGTATTFNIVSKNGYFYGGLIIPGINNLIKSYPSHLTNKLRTPITSSANEIFACSTAQAVKSGLYFTISGICEKIKQEMENKLKTKPYTIATGGGIKLMPSIKNIFNKIDANLTLKGLAIIYQNIKGVKND